LNAPLSFGRRRDHDELGVDQLMVVHCVLPERDTALGTLIQLQGRTNLPSGAKAHADFAASAARLKSCPFKTSTDSETPW
jgi:hypothetical protein